MTDPRHDPLDVLRASIDSPLPDDLLPDPAFAAELRERLQRVLELPANVTTDFNLGVNMTTDTLTPTPVAVAGTGALAPYIAVSDGLRAIDWYVAVFGAGLVGEPIIMPDGRVGHSELNLRGSKVYLATEHPEIGFVAPTAAAGSAVSLHLDVKHPGDVDSIAALVIEHGGELEGEVSDSPYGRRVTFRDPFGHRWMVISEAGVAADGVETMREGDLAYSSLWVDDSDRAVVFFANVFGWRLERPAPGEDNYLITDQSSPAGITKWPGNSLMIAYGTHDIEAARQRVIDAGGVAEPATTAPYGTTSMCRDTVGHTFALWLIPPGTPRPPENGVKHGDLGYVSMQVTDSASAREFYSAVFGWTFTGGRVSDGWNIEGPSPMTGLAGGFDRNSILPCYLVDDIEVVVEKVRAEGGVASDAEQQAYGRQSLCDDGQGTAFYLLEL